MFFCLLFGRLGLGTQGFVLEKQALYCLSHASSPFCSSYFGGGGLKNYLPGLSSNHDPPNLSLNMVLKYQRKYAKKNADQVKKCFPIYIFGNKLKCWVW
jgi:hypothetical protein